MEETLSTASPSAVTVEARLGFLEARMASIESLLRGRRQYMTYAGWVVAALVGALAKGGDFAVIAQTFLELLSTGTGIAAP